MFIEEYDGRDPMECDEELLRGFAERTRILGGRWFSDMTPTEARATFTRLSGAQRGERRPDPDIGHIVDEVAAAGTGQVRLRIYRPRATGRVPVVVFFHGGGWVFGDIDSYDDTGRLICRACDAVVVSVDYPLAPEHRFPAPFRSCVAAVRWVQQNIAALGGDPDAMVVMGDSAGANLAAATALECAELGIELAGQAILYGPFVHMDLVGEAGLRAWADRDQRFGPTATAASWYWGHYVGSPESARHPRASVLLEPDLKKAPPAIVAAGVLDTFCEESVAYGHRLADSGVRVSIRRYPRLTHGYLAHGSLPKGRRSELAHRAAMDTLAKVRELAYS